MTDDEVRQLAEKMTPADLHKIMLAMIDMRMDAKAHTERGEELKALAEACSTYESIVFPIT